LPEDSAATALGTAEEGLTRVELSKVAFIKVLFKEELLIEELFAIAEAGEPLGDGTSFPLETEETARFRSPIYTIDPPGDHWAETLKARAKNITTKTTAAFFAFDICIDSSIWKSTMIRKDALRK
jgi:hypothetical protein